MVLSAAEPGDAVALRDAAADSVAPGPGVSAPTARLSCAVLIPAYNEAPNVAAVVSAARNAELGRVLVVDDGSTDNTAQVAEEAGAMVLRLDPNRGKGAAVRAGARHLSESVVVLVDADLVDLQPEHVRALARPVLDDEAEMTRGVFSGGRWSTTTAQLLTPQLSGQRALVRTALLEVPNLEGSRFGAEVVLNSYARRAGWRCIDVPMAGASQVMKEEKRGFRRGTWARARMYGDILLALLRTPRGRKRP